MTYNEILQTRRSIRKYEDKPVEKDILCAIGEAGRIAPSARNRQLWHFVAITHPALRAQLTDVCDAQTFPATAPAVLVVYHTGDRQMSCGQSAATMDGAIALTCMMLKATELGLGTCWLGAFSSDKVKTLLALPADATVIAMMPVGYPAESPAPRPRKTLNEVFEIR